MGNPKYFDREDELAEVLHWWKTKKKPQPPCQTKGYRLKKLPRRITIGTTAFFHEKHTKLTTYWLELYYSVGKSKNPRGCDRLWIPLNCSRYHLNQLQLGKVKTVHLVKHKDTKRWIAHFSVVIDIDQTPPPDKPVAVVGIDLGMKKAATAVLLTAARQLKGNNIQFFNQDKQRRAINKLDDTIASLQLKKARYESTSKCTKNVVRKLKQGASKRRQLAIQSDHELTARISRWIKLLEHRYTVHVAVGQLKGIRNSRWKGDGNSRKHRRDLHRWPFARFTTMIQYKLQRLGFSPSRFVLMKESWTSKTCWKCGSTDTHRPFQSLLICNSCGAHLQADINGAVNIGLMLICSLEDEATLDHWLTKPLLDKKYDTRRVRVAGRKSSRTRRTSLTSSPSSGDDMPSSVNLGMKSASYEPVVRACTSTNTSDFSSGS